MQHPMHDQIDGLARAGFVTHIVANGGPVDALFAASQTQDLPQVRFVMVCDDGLVALGCPDGVPDLLRDIATPYHAADTAPDSDSPPDVANAISPQHSDIMEKIDQILDHVAPLPSGLSETSHRLTQLLDRPDPAPEMDEQRKALGLLSEAMATLIEGADNGSVAGPEIDLAPLCAQLRDLSAEQETLARAINTALAQAGDPVDTAGSDQILAQMCRHFATLIASELSTETTQSQAEPVWSSNR